MVIFQYKSLHKMVKFQHVFKQNVTLFQQKICFYPSIHRSNHPSKEYHRHKLNFYPCQNQRPWDFLHVPYFSQILFHMTCNKAHLTVLRCNYLFLEHLFHRWNCLHFILFLSVRHFCLCNWNRIKWLTNSLCQTALFQPKYKITESWGGFWYMCLSFIMALSLFLR